VNSVDLDRIQYRHWSAFKQDCSHVRAGSGANLSGESRVGDGVDAAVRAYFSMGSVLATSQICSAQLVKKLKGMRRRTQNFDFNRRRRLKSSQALPCVTRSPI